VFFNTTIHTKFVSQVSGPARECRLTVEVSEKITLPCGCRCENNSVYQHSNAVICGKSFTAGEGLRRGRRSGSVITAVVGGRSMYGLVKKFIRVCCIHLHYRDFAILSWLPPPTYPDNDPLTVKISTLGIDVNNLHHVSVLPLNSIQPSRVLVEIDRRHDCLFVMRMEGLDTLPPIE